MTARTPAAKRKSTRGGLTEAGRRHLRPHRGSLGRAGAENRAAARRIAAKGRRLLAANERGKTKRRS